MRAVASLRWHGLQAVSRNLRLDLRSRQQIARATRFCGTSSVADVPTTDATFRYRTFEWQTTCGEPHDYEYVIVQQPAGGGTARRDALAALGESPQRPPSGWSMVLLPTVSWLCTGKEEMRAIASGLSQRGHRCYILEWPGWTGDAQINWALGRCKPEELSAEYEDFWCQALEHLAASESHEATEAGANPPRLCLVAAGHAAPYALQALKSLRAWEGASAAVFESLVLLAPTWESERSGFLRSLDPSRASRLLGTWLHSESHFARMVRRAMMSPRSQRRHLSSRRGTSSDTRAEEVAKWLLTRPRPHVQTDGAAAAGLLDRKETTAASMAEDIAAAASDLRGALLLSPEATVAPGAKAGWSALATKLRKLGNEKVELQQLQVNSPVPHEDSPTAVLFALEQWVSGASEVATSRRDE